MHNKKDGYKKLPKTDVMNVQSKKKKKSVKENGKKKDNNLCENGVMLICTLATQKMQRDKERNTILVDVNFWFPFESEQSGIFPFTL